MVNIKTLLLAAGGAGIQGGGGAGGYIYNSLFSISLGSYSIVVGNGVSASNGQDTTFSTLTAIGGGKGGTGTTVGANGGCGGGGGEAARYPDNPYQCAGGVGSQGYNGGVGGSSYYGAPYWYSGSGGGLGSVGGSMSTTPGSGITNPLTGSGTIGVGGAYNGGAGTANTGNGGGAGQIGGSGFVQIAYKTDGTDGIGTLSTGGTITTSGDYTIHTFTTSGTFVGIAPLPVLTTEAVSSIDIVTAVGNGTVTSDSGSVITERGICWKTSTGPTTSDSKIAVAGTTGAFTGAMTGLSAETLYYVRAYATNFYGTTYGNEVTFTTLALNTYQIVKDIGGISGATYAVSVNVTRSAGSVTLKLGTTGASTTITTSGVTVLQGIYGGLSGLIIERTIDFVGTINDVMWVLVVGNTTINWALDTLTNLYLIDSSVKFKRIEDKEVDRFNMYRYMDPTFKDLDGYVTVTLTEEANDASQNRSKTFIVGNTTGSVSPFVKKRISMLSKRQAILIGFSNAKLNETFTICQYSLTGFKETRKLYQPSKIISI